MQGLGWVILSSALERKYSNAGKEWGWQSDALVQGVSPSQL